MSQKKLTFKGIMGLILFLGIIIGIIYLTYNYWSSILNFIENMIFYTCVVLAGVALLYGLYYYTRKWFLGQLSKNETSVALAILVFSIYGSLFYWLIELYKPYSYEIDLVFYYFMKIFIGFLICCASIAYISSIIGINIEKKGNKINNVIAIVILILIFISVVLIQYFFEEDVIYLFENFWYYIVPIFFVIVIWGNWKDKERSRIN